VITLQFYQDLLTLDQILRIAYLWEWGSGNVGVGESVGVEEVWRVINSLLVALRQFSILNLLLTTACGKASPTPLTTLSLILSESNQRMDSREW
jgi:hypothetical protein